MGFTWETGAMHAQEPRARVGGVYRRRWLQFAGAFAAVGAVGAGTYAGYDQLQRFGRSPARGIRDHRVSVPPSVPKLVIAHGSNPSRNVLGALDRMGGMSQFVRAGDRVVIKPNVAWDRLPAHAATTNPEVVATLVRACIEARAREVIVTDCPVDDAEKSFLRSGILAAARDAGASVVLPSQSRYEVVRVSDALGAWDVLEPFVLADKIINVPIVKHHGSAGVTAGMKNWIGVTTKRRSTFHTRLDASIAELAALMRPTLTVADATRVLLRNGPRGGDLGDVKQLELVALSTDPVALDAWATDLLQTPIANVEYLRLAQDMRLGVMDYRRLQPVELSTG